MQRWKPSFGLATPEIILVRPKERCHLCKFWHGNAEMETLFRSHENDFRRCVVRSRFVHSPSATRRLPPLPEASSVLLRTRFVQPLPRTKIAEKHERLDFQIVLFRARLPC